MGEFWLAVCPQVFVPETAYDLIVAVKTRDHEDLFEELGRLWQGVELAGIKPAGNEVVPGPFGGALRKEGGFYFDETLLVKKRARGLGYPVSEPEGFKHLGTSQVKVAVFEAVDLCHLDFFVQGKGRSFGGV